MEPGSKPKLSYPQKAPEYARVCLSALANRELGRKLSLGGAFGLAYYYEYRSTHDVDAWWEDVSEADRQAVITCLQEALQPYGQIHVRSWGDVHSVELIPNGEKKVCFSFQIASRPATLDQPVPAPWPEGLLVDALTDIVASKMVALVERGAPRDFRDIYSLCHVGLISSLQCWQLWQKRQELTKGDFDANRARLAIQTHLSRIEAHRPLSTITDPTEQESARLLRSWFDKEFLNVLLD